MNDDHPGLPPDIDGRVVGRRRPRNLNASLPPQSQISRLRAWLTLARVIGVIASIAGPGIVGYTLVKVVVDDRSASSLVREAVNESLRTEARQGAERARSRLRDVGAGWRACEPGCELGDRLVGAWDRLVAGPSAAAQEGSGGFSP